MAADHALTPNSRTPELFESIIRRGSGNLDEVSYPLVLLALALAEKSGVLELRKNQLVKTIVFDAGVPVDCRSNIATETFGRYLTSMGKISEQDCHVALAVAATRGVPLGEILVERKLITPTALYRELQQNLGRKLLEPFSWITGTWSISDEMPPIGSVLRARVPQLLATGILKVEPQEAADAAVARAYGRYLALSDEPVFGLDAIRLTPDQKRVVEAARAGAAFDELRNSGEIDTDDLHRILHGLLLLGIVVLTSESTPQIVVVSEEILHPFVTAVDVAVATDEAAPSPLRGGASEPAEPAAMSFVAAAATPVAVPPASAEEVMAAYLSYRRKDAFDLLGVEETATLPEVNEAFLKACEGFLPSKFDLAAPDGLREKARDLLFATAKAYADLADPSRREALLKRRESLRELAAREQAAPSTYIDPEALYQTGRTLAAAGKIREALSSFEMAAECDAHNGSYAAEAAWCRFQLNPATSANVLKMLKNAIRIDPKSGVAHLYAGRVQAALGNRLEAQAYLGRAATLMPADPRPAEAMRQIGA